MTSTANCFFNPPDELATKVQFGFLLGEYRRQGALPIRRLPSVKATIYYASDIRGTGAIGATGLFCEGPSSRAWELERECGEVIAFKVRAGALDALLGCPAREVRDRTVALDDIWGAGADELLQRMAAAPSWRERRDLFSQELIRRCRANPDRAEAAMTVARAIERKRGRTPIADLAKRAGLSQRLLLKRFDDSVGLTPKQYARIARLRSAIVKLAECRGELARLALDCGFCDQAHLIHEFQDLLGCSPAEFAARRHRFSPAGAPSQGWRALPSCERRLYPWIGQVSTWTDQLPAE